MQVRYNRAVWARHRPEPVVVIWRNLNWSEYKYVTSRRASIRSSYVETYRICLIEGPTVETATAGIITWIARQQLIANGFEGTYDALNPAIEQGRSTLASSYITAARAVVAWAFRYSFEEIDKWDSPTFFERLAQAEYILGKPLVLKNPYTAAEEKPTGKPLSRVQQVNQKRRERKMGLEQEITHVSRR